MNPKQADQEFKQFFLNGYRFDRCIGRGTFSTAYEVFSVKYQTTYCAKATGIREDMLDQEGKLCDHEMTALLKLDHEGVIRMFDYFVYDRYLFVILQYCPYGTLDQLIRSQGKMNSQTFLPFALRLAEALNYCHSNMIAHRDIKPQNIFLNQGGLPVLGDFGLSSILSPHQTYTESCGTLNFAAPEIFSNAPYDPFKADVWSLGVTFYQMITGKLPWKDEAIREHKQGATVIIPSYVDHKLGLLIRSMLNIIPVNRPTMVQVLHNQYFEPIVHVPERKTLSMRKIPTISMISNPVCHSQLMLRSDQSSKQVIHRRYLQIENQKDSIRKRSLRSVISYTVSTPTYV